MIEDTRDGTTILRFERLAREASLRHIVTTRRAEAGGEFRPDLALFEYRRRLARLLCAPGKPVVFLNQVHGARVLVVDADTGDGCAGDADALVTDDAHVALAVKGADCPLVLLYDPVRPALGVAHSGWRGTVAHVAGKTVTVMAERFGSDPSGLLVGIGPSVGSCCYEVGEDVAARFDTEFSPGVVVRRSARKAFVDLAAAVRCDLCAAGLASERIESAGLCTSCWPGLLHSYRRDGACAGRNVLLACLR